MDLAESAALAFVLGTMAGVVIGAIFGFTYGCLAAFVIGFLIVTNVTKLKE